MTTENDYTDDVVIARLLEDYDPVEALGLAKGSLRGRVNALSGHAEAWSIYIPDGERPDNYDIGRIAYMVDRMADGWEPDPIEVANQCERGRIYNAIVVTDGHHRLVAAILAGRKTIRATVGGLVSIADYLSGRSDEAPLWGEVGCVAY